MLLAACCTCCIKFSPVNLYIKKQVVKTTRGCAYAHEKISFVYKVLYIFMHPMYFIFLW